MAGDKSISGENGLRNVASAAQDASTSSIVLGEHAPVGLIGLDLNGHIRNTNHTATGMFGKPREELLHRPFAALVEPEFGETWQRCFAEVLQHDGPSACELMFINSGPPLPMRVACKQLPDAGDAPVRVALVDLGVPLVSGHGLTESLELYRTAFENIKDIYYRTDADGRLVLVSPSCLSHTGYSREELIGQPATDFYADPDERERMLAELRRHGHINDYEIELVHRNGTHKTASVTSRLLHDENGKPAGVEGILRDITARKQAQEKLSLSEKRYRLLFEQIADYALVLEDDGDRPPIIIDANQAALDKHGYTADELFGKPITVIARMTQEMVKDRLRELRSGEQIVFESIHRCKNDHTFPAEVIARRTRIGDRSITFAVERDITTRKENERLQASLLTENRKLIRRLMEVQEEERRMLARELHDELGQLLTVINARAELITRITDDKEVCDAATAIVDDTQALFEASYATRMSLRPGSLDTLGLSAALAELTSQRTRQSGMNCSLRIEGEPDSLDDMHAITIYRLVQEALTNAHRHGKAKHVEVNIRHVPPAHGKAGQVTVEVDDNGHGLHVTDMVKGMGVIGMRERVFALGGSFHFTSVPGDGVRIEAVLPLEAERRPTE